MIWLVILTLGISLITLVTLLSVILKQKLATGAKAGQKLGKFKQFLSRLFGVNGLSMAYRGFIRSLSIWQRISYRWKPKYIAFDLTASSDESKKVVDITVQYGAVYCTFFPAALLQVKTGELNRFLAKLCKGRLDGVIWSVDLDVSSMPATDDSIEGAKRLLTALYLYFSKKIQYHLSLRFDESLLDAKGSKLLFGSKKAPLFFPQCLPDESALAALVPDESLLALQDKLDSKELITLFSFLAKVSAAYDVIEKSHKQIQNEEQRYYAGFSLTPKGNNEPFKHAPWTTKAHYKFRIRFRRIILGAAFLGASFYMGYTYIQVSQQNKKALKLAINDTNYQSQSAISGINKYLISLQYNQLTDMQRRVLLFRNHRSDMNKLWHDNLVKRIQETAVDSFNNNPIKLLALMSLAEGNDIEKTKSQSSFESYFFSSLTHLSVSDVILWQSILGKKSTKLNFNALAKSISEANFHIDKKKVLKGAKKYLGDYKADVKPVSRWLSWYQDAAKLIFVNQIYQSNLQSELSDTQAPYSQKMQNYDNQIIFRFSLQLSQSEYSLLREALGVYEVQYLLDQLTSCDDVYSLLYTLKAIKEKLTLLPIGYEQVMIKHLLIALQGVKLKKLSAYINQDYYYSRDYYKFIESSLDLNYVELVKSYQARSKVAMHIEEIFNQAFSAYIFNYLAYNQGKLEAVLSADSKDPYKEGERLKSLANSNQLVVTVNHIISNLSVFADKNNKVALAINALTLAKENISRYQQILQKIAKVSAVSPFDSEQARQSQNSALDELGLTLNQFTQKIQAGNELKAIFFIPLTDAKVLVNAWVKEKINAFWHINISPIYVKLYQYFPFDKNSDQDISIDELINLLGKNGVYEQKMADFRDTFSQEPDYLSMLNVINAAEYKRLSAVKDTFWSQNGAPKAVSLQVTTQGALAISNQGENDNKLVAYTGLLLIGDEKLYSMGVNKISQVFHLKWWHENLSSVNLLNQSFELVDSIPTEGHWSIWSLMRKAKTTGNIYTWKLSHRGKISFEIKPIEGLFTDGGKL